MIDRENVIENLEQNIRWIEGAVDVEVECHQFPGWGNVTMAMRDAAELLKEQEAVSPNIKVNVNGIYYVCGNCGEMMFGYKYCPNCGRMVKWNAAD